MSTAQVLSVAQMRAAEQAIFDAGTSVDTLMNLAGTGAAEWVRRIAAGRAVTVLCGPGNNGGDGYVIARRLLDAGNRVTVVAPLEPTTKAARNARTAYSGEITTSGGLANGEVLVDALFGSGLSRPLSAELLLLLRDLAKRHPVRVAIDLPSGVESDHGRLLNERLPDFSLTLALGAWKFAHWRLPARAIMGTRRMVPIGIEAADSAAQVLGRPNLSAPPSDSHKYTRGLCMIVAGAMPGAAQLAAAAAMRGGAGYVQLATEQVNCTPPDLVVRKEPLKQVLQDQRIASLLVGPGLGRDAAAEEILRGALAAAGRCVVDADGLVLLKPGMLSPDHEAVLTPHDGELATLCSNFAVLAEGRMQRAMALAKASGAVVLAKGPDSIVASPAGEVGVLPPAPSWLSVAGSGDVLAGIVASRMAAGCPAFDAAAQAAWLHGEAARLCEAPFTASDLARAVTAAYSAAL